MWSEGQPDRGMPSMSGSAMESKESAANAPKHPQWIGWVQVAMGLGLAAASGLWVGRAWSDRNLISWMVGAGSLICGVLLAVVGMRWSSPPKQARRYLPLEPPKRKRERTIPYLGELLVYKHRIISERQLQEALEEQRARGGRLGQILVAMGHLKYSKLSEVLEDQLSYGEPKRGLDGDANRGKAAAVETR